MDLTDMIEKVDFEGSLKDILTPSRKTVTKDLISKCKTLINRVRWHVFNKTHSKVNNIENSNDPLEIKNLFRIRKAPPTSHLLDDFEDKIWNLVRNIEFKIYPNRNNPYLRYLNDKIKDLRKSKDIFLFSDKTKNIYKINPYAYDSLLHNELCKNYRTINESVLTEFNAKARKVMLKLDIEDRTEPFIPRIPRITLKDHKKTLLLIQQ